MAARPRTVLIVGRFGCDGRMAGGAVARSAGIIEQKSGAIIRFVRVSRQSAGLAPLGRLALLPVYVRSRIKREEAMVDRRTGVLIGLPLGIFPVARSAACRPFHAVFRCEPFVLAVIALRKGIQGDREVIPICRARIE